MPVTIQTPNIPATYIALSATFGQRFSAAFIDLFLLTILMFLVKISFPDFGNMLFFEKASPFVTDNGVNWVLNKSSLIVVWIFYSLIMDSTVMQGTIGKQAMGILVTDETGKRISFSRSAARNLFKIVSYAMLGFGFIYVLWDKKSRGWHDVFANTLVIKKPVRKN